jgi:hypothetical protein
MVAQASPNSARPPRLAGERGAPSRCCSRSPPRCIQHRRSNTWRGPCASRWVCALTRHRTGSKRASLETEAPDDAEQVTPAAFTHRCSNTWRGPCAIAEDVRPDSAQDGQQTRLAGERGAYARGRSLCPLLDWNPACSEPLRRPCTCRSRSASARRTTETSQERCRSTGGDSAQSDVVRAPSARPSNTELSCEAPS